MAGEQPENPEETPKTEVNIGKVFGICAANAKDGFVVNIQNRQNHSGGQLAQILVGAAAVWLKFPVSLIALHLAMATAVWGTMAALATLSLAQPRARTALVQELAHD